MQYMIGKRIVERRKELGMSQETLAKKSGLCRTTVSAIENGKNHNNILVGSLVALADALETTVDLFFV